MVTDYKISVVESLFSGFAQAKYIDIYSDTWDNWIVVDLLSFVPSNKWFMYNVQYISIQQFFLPAILL